MGMGMGMGMDGCSVSIFCGVWASSRTIPRWEIFTLFSCDLLDLLGFVLFRLGDLGHRHVCVERRECRIHV